MPNASTLIREAAAACRASPYLEIPGDRRAEAEELLECAAGRPIASDELVEGAVLARFRRLTARRVAGEPLEYLTGQATVRDMKLQVDRGGLERLPRGRGDRTGKRTADADRGRCLHRRGAGGAAVCRGIAECHRVRTGHLGDGPRVRPEERSLPRHLQRSVPSGRRVRSPPRQGAATGRCRVGPSTVCGPLGDASRTPRVAGRTE